MCGHTEAPNTDEAKVNEGREDWDPDVDDEADGFYEQDECGEDGDDDVVFGDPSKEDLVLVVLRMR